MSLSMQTAVGRLTAVAESGGPLDHPGIEIRLDTQPVARIECDTRLHILSTEIYPFGDPEKVVWQYGEPKGPGYTEPPKNKPFLSLDTPLGTLLAVAAPNSEEGWPGIAVLFGDGAVAQIEYDEREQKLKVHSYFSDHDNAATTLYRDFGKDAPARDTRSVLTEAEDIDGWNDDTKIAMLCRFIDQAGLADAFNSFVRPMQERHG